jgi:hypothetical protein
MPLCITIAKPESSVKRLTKLFKHPVHASPITLIWVMAIAKGLLL